MTASAFCAPSTNHPAIAELAGRPQWVGWKYKRRFGGKPTKPPVSPRTGQGASHSRPSDWSSFEHAIDFAKSQGMAGIGFVLAEDDDLTGGDLDNCRDPATGEIEVWAKEILALAETYAEVSPSGAGIRLIWRGKVEKTIKRDVAQVEVYGRQRYLTITGDHIAGTPTEIRPAPRTLAALTARVASFERPAEPSEAPKNRLRENEDGTATDLETGEDFDSLEEAERALAAERNALRASAAQMDTQADGTSLDEIAELLSYVDPDLGYPEWLEVLMAVHALTGGSQAGQSLADQWSARGSKYKSGDVTRRWSRFRGGAVGGGTLAIHARRGGANLSEIRIKHMPKDESAGTAEHGAEVAKRLRANWSKDQESKEEEPASTSTSMRGTLIDFSEDRPYVHELELIRDTLPQTGFAFIGGQSGAGKSFLVNKLAACFTTGEPFAGRKIERTGGVLILASEGQGTLAGRMKATRLRLPDPTIRLPIAAIGDFGSIAKAADYTALRSRILEVAKWMEDEHGVPLVAFFLDTISAFNMIAEDKENDPAAWNLLMGNLKKISVDIGALAIGVHHYGKSASAGLRGSSGAWANADTILSVTGERDLRTGEVFDRAIALAKNRNGPEGPIGGVELRPVAIGHREDGSEVRSLVFEIDTGIMTVNAKTMKRPTKAQVAFMEAFRSALSDHSSVERVHGMNEGAKVSAVDAKHVQREFALRYVVVQDDEKKRADTLRKQFQNGLKKAEEAGLVCSGAWAGTEWIWSREVDLGPLMDSMRTMGERRNGME